MGHIYKILPVEEWQAFEQSGHYEGSTRERERGFITLATAEQLRPTLNSKYEAHEQLVLVQVPAEPLGKDLVWELSGDGDMRPQLHGILEKHHAAANWFIGDGSFLPEAAV